MGLFKKKTQAVELTLEERAESASLNGANALAVFEQAASDLDASALALRALASEAHEKVDVVMGNAQVEVDLIQSVAEATVHDLRKLGEALDDEAAGHVVRAGKIRELVGA